MIPGTRDYNEILYGSDYYDTPEEVAASVIQRTEREAIREEEKLREAWLKNRFPVTIEEYIQQMEKQLNDYSERASSQWKSRCEERAKLDSKIAELKKGIVYDRKCQDKAGKVRERNAQTLSRRIKKLLDNYVDCEEDEE